MRTVDDKERSRRRSRGHPYTTGSFFPIPSSHFFPHFTALTHRPPVRNLAGLVDSFFLNLLLWYGSQDGRPPARQRSPCAVRINTEIVNIPVKFLSRACTVQRKYPHSHILSHPFPNLSFICSYQKVEKPSGNGHIIAGEGEFIEDKEGMDTPTNSSRGSTNHPWFHPSLPPFSLQAPTELCTRLATSRPMSTSL